MEINNYIKDQFSAQSAQGLEGLLSDLRQDAFSSLLKNGIPTRKHEEWKYSEVPAFFEGPFQIASSQRTISGGPALPDVERLPFLEGANLLVFINGAYHAERSRIVSPKSELTVCSLENALNGPDKEIVTRHLGESDHHSYDGIQSLNTAFMQDGMFIKIIEGQQLSAPLYIYHIADGDDIALLISPRNLIVAEARSGIKIVELCQSLGMNSGLSNHVLELVIREDAAIEHYRIQNDQPSANQVNTLHVKQTGRSNFHSVIVSLDGGIIRNNLNVIMEASGSTCSLYGAYFLGEKTQVDNHTLVDHTAPGCISTELYKGILDGHSKGVFNGKILVRPDAQKTNAYQTNKNILLSEDAEINTKPQLEIFADDVKCSHGCTIGQLDEEALFYLHSRGISKADARSFLLQAFVLEIVDQIRIAPLKIHVQQLLNDRLPVNI